MNRVITVQPHFTNSAAMLRQIEATPRRRNTRPTFDTVIEPRDVECWNCGTVWENTTRRDCKCGEAIDA